MNIAGSTGLSGGVLGFPDICIETCISNIVLSVCAAVCVLLQYMYRQCFQHALNAVLFLWQQIYSATQPCVVCLDFSTLPIFLHNGAALA